MSHLWSAWRSAISAAAWNSIAEARCGASQAPLCRLGLSRSHLSSLDSSAERYHRCGMQARRSVLDPIGASRNAPLRLAPTPIVPLSPAAFDSDAPACPLRAAARKVHQRPRDGTSDGRSMRACVLAGLPTGACPNRLDGPTRGSVGRHHSWMADFSSEETRAPLQGPNHVARGGNPE